MCIMKIMRLFHSREWSKLGFDKEVPYVIYTIKWAEQPHHYFSKVVTVVVGAGEEVEDWSGSCSLPTVSGPFSLSSASILR